MIRIDAEGGKGAERLGVDIAAGRIGRTVGSVTSEREEGRTLDRCEISCSGKGDLLIAPAKAVAFEVNDRLAAGKKREGFSGLTVGFQVS